MCMFHHHGPKHAQVATSHLLRSQVGAVLLIIIGVKCAVFHTETLVKFMQLGVARTDYLHHKSCINVRRFPCLVSPCEGDFTLQGLTEHDDQVSMIEATACGTPESDDCCRNLHKNSPFSMRIWHGHGMSWCFSQLQKHLQELPLACMNNRGSSFHLTTMKEPHATLKIKRQTVS